MGESGAPSLALGTDGPPRSLNQAVPTTCLWCPVLPKHSVHGSALPVSPVWLAGISPAEGGGMGSPTMGHRSTSGLASISYKGSSADEWRYLSTDQGQALTFHEWQLGKQNMQEWGGRSPRQGGRGAWLPTGDLCRTQRSLPAHRRALHHSTLPFP